MQLGQQLVNSILSDPIERSTVKHVKGICNHKRDYAIACRLYYHFRLKGLRYDVALEELKNEFYLGETTLAQIIMREREAIEQLKTDNADRKTLQKLLPHYSWV